MKAISLLVIGALLSLLVLVAAVDGRGGRGRRSISQTYSQNVPCSTETGSHPVFRPNSLSLPLSADASGRFVSRRHSQSMLLGADASDRSISRPDYHSSRLGANASDRFLSRPYSHSSRLGADAIDRCIPSPYSHSLRLGADAHSQFISSPQSRSFHFNAEPSGGSISRPQLRNSQHGAETRGGPVVRSQAQVAQGGLLSHSDSKCSKSTSSSQMVSGNPVELNMALDELIRELVTQSRRQRRNTKAPSVVVNGLDTILAGMRVQQPTVIMASDIVGSSSLFQCVFWCWKPSKATAKERLRFIRSLVRQDSSAYLKLGALLMAMTPVADLTDDDLDLISLYLKRLMPADYDVLAPLTFYLIRRLSPGVLQRHDFLGHFVKHVLVRVVPLHFHTDQQRDADPMSFAGPVITHKAFKNTLTYLLLHCRLQEVDNAVTRARHMLQPRPWSQLFLDGIMRLYGAKKGSLQSMFGEAYTPHVLAEFAVRACPKTSLLISVMMSDSIQTWMMPSYPRSMRNNIGHNVVAELSEWYKSRRDLGASPIMLSHLSSDERIEAVNELLSRDRTDNEGEFPTPPLEGKPSTSLWKLCFYGASHFHLLGSAETHPLYKNLDAKSISRVVLSIATWSQTEDLIPSDVTRSELPEIQDHSQDVSTDRMVVLLLRSVRHNVRIATNPRRNQMIEELIARCWTMFDDFESIIEEAFAPGSALQIDHWVSGVKASNQEANCAFSLLSHVMKKFDQSELDLWREALERNLTSTNDLHTKLQTLDIAREKVKSESDGEQLPATVDDNAVKIAPKDDGNANKARSASENSITETMSHVDGF